MINKVFFVTTNGGKLGSAKRALESCGIEVVHVDRELREIQAKTSEEVAAAKAHSAFNEVRMPVIVNDVGVYIDGLNGFPGPYLKDVNRQIGLQGYLDLMTRFAAGQRDCTVVDAIAFMDGIRAVPQVFTRKIRGTIAESIRGERRKDRMSLSPLFIPHGCDKSYAEMTAKEYDEFRSRAENVLVYKRLAAAIQGLDGK